MYDNVCYKYETQVPQSRTGVVNKELKGVNMQLGDSMVIVIVIIIINSIALFACKYFSIEHFKSYSFSSNSRVLKVFFKVGIYSHYFYFYFYFFDKNFKF